MTDLLRRLFFNLPETVENAGVPPVPAPPVDMDRFSAELDRLIEKGRTLIVQADLEEARDAAADQQLRAH
jgi:hypothetical protein